MEDEVPEHAVDPSSIVSLIRDFLGSNDQGYDDTATEETESQEEAGSLLWDLSASAPFTRSLVDCHILPCLEVLIEQCHHRRACGRASGLTYRLLEIALGILANLMVLSEHLPSLCPSPDLKASVVRAFECEDARSLSECSRLLCGVFKTQDAGNWWREGLVDWPLVERVIYLLQLSLDADFLTRGLGFLESLVQSGVAPGEGWKEVGLVGLVLEVLKDANSALEATRAHALDHEDHTGGGQRLAGLAPDPAPPASHQSRGPHAAGGGAASGPMILNNGIVQEEDGWEGEPARGSSGAVFRPLVVVAVLDLLLALVDSEAGRQTWTHEELTPLKDELVVLSLLCDDLEVLGALVVLMASWADLTALMMVVVECLWKVCRFVKELERPPDGRSGVEGPGGKRVEGGVVDPSGIYCAGWYVLAKGSKALADQLLALSLLGDRDADVSAMIPDSNRQEGELRGNSELVGGATEPVGTDRLQWRASARSVVGVSEEHAGGSQASGNEGGVIDAPSSFVALGSALMSSASGEMIQLIAHHVAHMSVGAVAHEWARVCGQNIIICLRVIGDSGQASTLGEGMAAKELFLGPIQDRGLDSTRIGTPEVQPHDEDDVLKTTREDGIAHLIDALNVWLTTLL